MSETTEVSIETLTKLYDYRREYFQICDEFKIPLERRGESHIARSIIERIHTYLTSYLIRRSLTEQSNGAAFTPSEPVTVTDPNTP